MAPDEQLHTAAWPAPSCPYCRRPAVLLTGADLYPHRPELSTRSFWRCAPCDAHVGCHKGKYRPLGTLANAELRLLRKDVHRLFDPLWQEGRMRRSEAYLWLAKRMGMREHEAHIGLFNEAECHKALRTIKKYRRSK